LHSLGLKPSQGKLAHHSSDRDRTQKIEYYIDQSWEDDKGVEVIKKWKELNE